MNLTYQNRMINFTDSDNNKVYLNLYQVKTIYLMEEKDGVKKIVIEMALGHDHTDNCYILYFDSENKGYKRFVNYLQSQTGWELKPDKVE